MIFFKMKLKSKCNQERLPLFWALLMNFPKSIDNQTATIRMFL